MADWQSNLITDMRGIADAIHHTKTIAVLGIKPESHADQAAHYVAAHMDAAVGLGIDKPQRFGDRMACIGAVARVQQQPVELDARVEIGRASCRERV